MSCIVSGQGQLARSSFLLFGLLVSICVMGCGPRLPVYPTIDSSTALDTIAGRNSAVQSIGARCRLILERPGDRSVELSAVFVSRPPHQYRLRAWKLTESIMDVTISDAGVWMWAKEGLNEPGEEGILASFGPRAGGTDYLREALNVALGVWDMTEWREAPGGNDYDQLVIDRPLNHLATMRCIIDKSSLTVKEVQALDEERRVRFALHLDRYRRFETAILPSRLRGAAQEHSFTMVLQHVDVNGELPPGAFQPPPGAIRQ